MAVFAFQSLDSYRDRMTQNMNRKHEKHTVPPPFEEVTNRLTMYAASLRRVYTAGGFLSNSGGRTWASPLRGDGFPRQCEHWLGMTARQRRADGTSYPKGICPAALHCRTPSPTKSQGVRRMGRGGRRPLRSRNGGAAKRADRCPPFTFLLYMTALSATMRCKNTAPACQAPHGHR